MSISFSAAPGPQGWFGSFYGQEGVVVADARVTATTRVDPGLPPGGRVLWQLLERPAGSGAALAEQDALGFSVAFVPERAGTYRVQAIGDYVSERTLPAAAELRVIPHHIEFVVDVTHSADSTTVVVHSGVSRPLGRRVATRGVAAVEAFLDGRSLGRLTDPNGRITFAENAHVSFEGTWDFTLERAALGPGARTLAVVVTDTQGLERHGALAVTAATGAHAEFFGF